MELDAQEDEKKSQDSENSPTSPNFLSKTLVQLISQNEYGGDKRIYKALRKVLKGNAKQITQVFDKQMLEFILNTKGNTGVSCIVY